ncbi:AccI family restriction endonuclease [Sphingopyxis sp.]|uniref:AccI family restriction endonuclease n=1 Tax=Sphingopyxis sp. TaxID=1908224 RepID=UPI003D0DBA7F
MTSYLGQLQEAAAAIIPVLKKLGVEQKYLNFNDVLEIPERFYPPSQSDSKFQAEQALGDWAENSVCDAINRQGGGIRAVHYGANSKLFAEDEGFRDAYIAGIKQTCIEGKRSDLLILPADVKADLDSTELTVENSKSLVAKSLGGLEIRSSRLNADQYRKYQNERLKAGKKPSSLEPNITVKVEDLVKVYLWNRLNNKPQAYVQVFFDEIHGLSFIEILRYIGSGEKLRVEKHKRSAKTTIMIPISMGKKIGSVTIPAEFDVVHNVTLNGRHDIFARPTGGNVEVDIQLVEQLLQ